MVSNITVSGEAMVEERVSALLDGECSAMELRQLLNDAAASPQQATRMMSAWSRMNRVRDALADQAVLRGPSVDTEQFCAGVMSRLGVMEPPAAETRVNPKPTIPLQAGAMPNRRRALRSAWRRRPVVGWAAAASVTLVMLAGGRAWMGSADPVSSSQNLALGGATKGQSVAVANGGGRIGLIPVSADEPTEVRWTQLDPDDVYLTEHNSLRADQGMNGALGYARLARNVEYRSNTPPR